MDLHKFNASLLNCMGIIDESGRGHLSRVLPSKGTLPFTISGKRVVLPTVENLRSPEDDTIVFHPLSENITRAESEVLKAMRDTIMYQLTYRTVTLLTELARVAATPSEHKRLDAASSKYLKKLGDFDERSYEFVHKALLRVGPEPEKRLISISLRKGKQADGVLRRAHFKFPVLESVFTEEPDLLGVKYPSKRSRAAIRSLFESVMGTEEIRATFDYGSKNLSAPYFDALMNAFFNMATHINQVIETHRKLLGKSLTQEDEDMADELMFDLSWYEGMPYLADMRKLVPPQEGNEGNILVSKAVEEPEAFISRAVPQIPIPRDREPAREARREAPIDLPWDDTPAPAIRSERPVLKRKSLDEVLHIDRDQRDTRSRYDRDDRDIRRDPRDDYSRDRGYRDDRDPRSSYDRHERPPTRRIDLGLDDGRDRDRYYDDRRPDPRDSRPGFGAGMSRPAPRW